jgi:hypothetical protein
VSGTHSPSAEGLEGLAPKTFQGRLTLAFVAVVAVTLGLVGLLVVNRLGAYFDQQQVDDLASRARSVAQYVVLIAESTDSVRAGQPVVSQNGIADSAVVTELSRESLQRFVADQLAQSDVRYRVGPGPPVPRRPERDLRSPRSGCAAEGPDAGVPHQPGDHRRGHLGGHSVRRRGHPAEPVHLPGDGPVERHRPCSQRRA